MMKKITIYIFLSLLIHYQIKNAVHYKSNICIKFLIYRPLVKREIHMKNNFSPEIIKYMFLLNYTIFMFVYWKNCSFTKTRKKE